MASNEHAAAEEELDIKELQGKRDKIRELMRRDPRFIGRLILVCDTATGGSDTYAENDGRCCTYRKYYELKSALISVLH